MMIVLASPGKWSVRVQAIEVLLYVTVLHSILDYIVFPIWMVQMLFPQIQYTPGPDFRKVGKFLLSAKVIPMSMVKVTSCLCQIENSLD